jgi:phosphatidylinositol alpha-1,6-mannosyltransferase
VILLAVNDFPPMVGGEATLYFGLARRLRRDEALVLAPRLPGDAAVDARLPAEVVRRPLPAARGGPSRAARVAVAGWHLARLLAARRVTFIACGQLLSLGAPTLLLARRHRLPYAVFVHGADLADYCGREPWRSLGRRIVRGARAVLVNSRFTAGLVDRFLPGAARRIEVLPLGVDPAPPAEPARVARLRRDLDLGEGPVLLSVARLVASKGHDVVLAALPELARRFPGLRYLVVGDGPRRPALERLARRLGVGGRVVFAGPVGGDDLPACYDLATLFVQMSRDGGPGGGVEGFGLTFLEAASHGLPALAGQSGGVAEAVLDGGSGLLLPPGDAGALVAAAGRLLEDDAARRRLAAGARRWAARHTWEEAAERLREVAGVSAAAAAPGGAPARAAGGRRF